ncbi:MAG: UDP-N-acetylmuramoyl-L-alanyl-D-glutamate--2,6-diaminopimelate ligase [Oscillospiraceae bacterium]|jgi:UDP-N-acetylmuramoyl-L-alanyl-D-glutamate--2,6-diaminopimelate ligase
MKLSDLLRGIDVLRTTVDLNTDINAVVYDSRKALPGCLFVAMAGFETDGHEYISSALEKGAAAVICQHAPAGAPCVTVSDPRAALARIGANFFRNPAEEMTIIGVTGTNGKTTTTYILKTLLEKAFGAKVGLIGTNQNMIGDKALPAERTTPESFELQALLREMADAGCTHVVMEVSSHALSLHRVDGISFRTGIFTNLTQDHLDFHRTMEDYLAAKAKLFGMCEAGIFNIDDEYAGELMKNAACRIFTYSAIRNEADLVAKNINLKPDRVEFEALTIDAISRAELHIPGRFSVYNALAAIAAMLELGAPLTTITSAIKSAKGVKGRMEVVPTGGRDFTIIIDYAHTPDALENVIRTVKDFSKGRTVVLFGCGGDRDPIKRPLMGQVAARLADYVIVTSDNPRTEKPEKIIEEIVGGMEGIKTPYTVITDRIEAIHYAIDSHESNDIIILAGKGHETYQIVGKTKRHMDEREIVAEWLARK